MKVQHHCGMIRHCYG